MKILIACTKNKLFALNDELPWKNIKNETTKKDMKYFVENTTGKKIIMGYKTYKSIGRLLPNRENVIMSRTRTIPGAIMCRSLKELQEKHMDGILIGGLDIINQVCNTMEVDEININVLDFVIHPTKLDSALYIDFGSYLKRSRLVNKINWNYF
tara:strand:- start:176 stop:637 length:462 start_codon:yes stop_codon:yes gene_type:complete